MAGGWGMRPAVALGLAAILAGCAGGAAGRSPARPAASLASSSASSTTASPFALRGVVEGFYGPPWSAGATAAVLSFMGGQGMNTFVYAPKSDPYQRAQWNKPYPPAQLAALRALVAAAAGSGVSFVYSLSPGLSITYSSAADRAALLTKLRQLRGIGVHAFMLSFDDLPNETLDPADARAYPGGMGQAQVALTNAVYAAERRVDPHFSLLFTPTEYWGVKSDPYTRALAGLAPAIDVLWTGPGVLSPQITLAQAQAFGAIVGRPPVLWYNYPVNDWTVPTGGFSAPVVQPAAMFLGPVQGLAPDLASGVRGILANPMLEAHASEIPLASLAAYLRNPAAASAPQAAWSQAVSAAGGGGAAALVGFCQAESPYPTVSRKGVYAWSSTDPALDAQEAQLLAAYAAGPAAAMASPLAGTLRSTFRAWMQGPVDLAPDRLAVPALGTEIAPWVRWMPRDGEAGLDALALLRATAGGDAPARALALAAVRQDEATLKTQPVQFGGNLTSFLTGALAAVGGT